MPTRTRCWLDVEEQELFQRGSLIERQLALQYRLTRSASPCHRAPSPECVARSQKTLDAVQHALSAAPDAVSYSVTRGMTLAAPIRSLNAAAPAAIGNSSLRICDARTDPVLASEDESRALAALRFSLASDIVELVVLTADEVFLQTLREAVGAARRLWHVLSPDKSQRPAGGGRRGHPGARRTGAATRRPRASSRTSSASFPISSSSWPANANRKPSSPG